MDRIGQPHFWYMIILFSTYPANKQQSSWTELARFSLTPFTERLVYKPCNRKQNYQLIQADVVNPYGVTYKSWNSARARTLSRLNSLEKVTALNFSPA